MRVKLTDELRLAYFGTDKDQAGRSEFLDPGEYELERAEHHPLYPNGEESWLRVAGQELGAVEAYWKRKAERKTPVVFLSGEPCPLAKLIAAAETMVRVLQASPIPTTEEISRGMTAFSESIAEAKESQ